MGEITTLTKASTKSDSLRTTVPTGIVSHFGLKEQDRLEWNIEVKDGTLIIVLRPVQKRITDFVKK
jgi:bifunctional DNA-binding transcriptional regulator/antitoxin component of YhaV-PrlF toxin-antitoxin module